MNRLFLAGAAALAFTAAPTFAQDAGVAVEAEGQVYEPTEAQQGFYNGWPAVRQASYDSWPREQKEYFWTLTPEQTEGWWALTNEQRAQVYSATPEQRAIAWSQIAAQMNGADSANASTTGVAASAAATSSATTSAGTTHQFVRSEVIQTTPAASVAAGAEYPPCKGDQKDSCVNPREAGLNYGNRPLQYWPGRPASEIDEPLPAEKPSEPKE